MSSEILRVIKGGLKETNSLVLIISQTRDNIGFGAMFQPKVRSGGKALKFYSCHEIWLTVGKKIKKKELDIGADVIAKVSKNKLTGKKRDADFSLYYDYGVDNIQACIKFLLDQNVWKKTKMTVDSNGFCDPCTEVKMIDVIEKENKEQELYELVQKAWNDREDAVKLGRKSKYE